ncbi:MAG: cysteine hydrolase [Anaerolineae bacterium]|nr:cysteine hydrolase [Anaerolineae bacterium]
MQPALLVIDVQKEFFKSNPVTAQSLNEAIEYINVAIALFREKNLPVICVQHVDEAENLKPGAADFDVPEALNVLPSDLHIHKTYSNSFNKTSLEKELQKRGVDTVIITGFCAEYCVLSTYRGAEDLDLTPLMLRGALVSGTLANITFVESKLQTNGEGMPQNRLRQLRELGIDTGIWWYADHPTHYRGDGSPATAEKGERLLAAQARALARAIRAIKEDGETQRLQDEFFAAAQQHGPPEQ